MKTKIAVLHKLKEPLKILEAEIPKLKRGQVLVKIKYSGICHSQINEIDGLRGEDRWLPHALGHEGSGEVVDVGEGVSKVEAGDRVVLTWIKSSGLEAEQIFYKSGNRIINSGPISTFAEFSVVSENRVVKIRGDIPLDIASLLGCAIPTGAGIVLNTLKAKASHSIVILGTGGVGLSAVMGASLADCHKIIAVDIIDEKLNIAKTLGANYTINANNEDVVGNVMKLTSGKGADFAIESAGIPKVMELGLSLINNKGTFVIAGNIKLGDRIRIDPFELIKGKRILGSWGGETNPDRDIPTYIRFYKEGKLSLDKLITRRFVFEEINKAIEDLREGKIAGRGIVEMEENK